MLLHIRHVRERVSPAGSHNRPRACIPGILLPTIGSREIATRKYVFALRDIVCVTMPTHLAKKMYSIHYDDK